jgi:hypothetical protein
LCFKIKCGGTKTAVVGPPFPPWSALAPIAFFFSSFGLLTKVNGSFAPENQAGLLLAAKLNQMWCRFAHPS